MDDPVTLEDLLETSEPYCVDHDFDPEHTGPDAASWTHKEKWFMSCLAVLDLKELLCLN